MRKSKPDGHPERPKSILKRNDQPVERVSRSDSITKSATFDEQNLLETLHPANKDYGHQKIDEPKTPFVMSTMDVKSTPVDPQVLNEKLLQLQIDQRRQANESASFAEKRRQHYDEAQCLKERKNAPPEPDDDDGDD